jgi:carbonic anhydrase
MKPVCIACHVESPSNDARRRLLRGTLAAAGGAVIGTLSLSADPAEAAALTQAQRDKLTPDDVLRMMQRGNQRFRAAKPQAHDYLAQKRASAAGQFPAAVIVSCIDSRAPAEIIFDTGIGEAFNARVAGNIANNDTVGGLEFACVLSGAKLVLVMGHTACGAIKGAIDNAQFGSLTGLLEQIKPAVAATDYSGERSAKNPAFVDAVARTNVMQTVNGIRSRSPDLARMEEEGRIRIVGSMYDLSTGAVAFFA